MVSRCDHRWIRSVDTPSDIYCGHCVARGLPCPLCDGFPQKTTCPLCHGKSFVKARTESQRQAMLSGYPPG